MKVQMLTEKALFIPFPGGKLEIQSRQTTRTRGCEGGDRITEDFSNPILLDAHEVERLLRWLENDMEAP